MINYISKKIILFSILFIFSCNKKEKVINETIQGSVVNTVNGKPIKNYTVYLASYYNTKKNNTGMKFPSSLITQTDNNGNFTFDNVSINQSSDYFYEVIVKNYAGSDFRSQPEVSRRGIDKSNTSNMHYGLTTMPLINQAFIVKLNPVSSIVYPDSINIELKHEFYYLVTPTSDVWFKRTLSSINFRNSNNGYFEGIPIGKWKLDILKIKNGITTNTTDSVVLNFDSQTTYTLSF